MDKCYIEITCDWPECIDYHYDECYFCGEEYCGRHPNRCQKYLINDLEEKIERGAFDNKEFKRWNKELKELKAKK